MSAAPRPLWLDTPFRAFLAGAGLAHAFGLYRLRLACGLGGAEEPVLVLLALRSRRLVDTPEDVDREEAILVAFCAGLRAGDGARRQARMRQDIALWVLHRAKPAEGREWAAVGLPQVIARFRVAVAPHTGRRLFDPAPDWSME